MEEPEQETPEDDTPEQEEPVEEDPVEEPDPEEEPEEEPQPQPSTWESDDVFQYDLYDLPELSEVTYHFDADGGLIETDVVFDVDLLAEIYFTDPENVTILTETAPLGVPTDLVTINDPIQGVQTISVTYTTFGLEIGTADDATLSFDWELGISAENEGIVLTTDLLHGGTMSGSLSADETTITWEAIDGTVTVMSCAPGSGFPCDEFSLPADEFYFGKPLGSWTDVTGG